MEDLRVGVVGCGAIGCDHIRRIAEKIQGAVIVAVADVFVEIGQKVASQWNVKFFQNGEDMINSDIVDEIIVSTLDEYHEQYVIAAIKANKFVFCEKPLAPDSESCLRIMNAEIDVGKKLLQVGFMRRYDVVYKELQKIAHSKTYGEPIMLHCAHRVASIAPNYVTNMLITNCAVHEIDVLRWVLGEDYVSCQVITPKPTKNSWDDLNDPVIVILKTKSGVHIDIEVFANCSYGYDIRCEMVCEEGTASLPMPSGTVIRTKGNKSMPISDDWQMRFADAYDVEFQQWVDEINNNDRVIGPTAWDGYACAVAATSCVVALETGTIQPIIYNDMPNFYKKLN